MLENEREQLWSQRLQRRIIRLLLQHDRPLFHQQFRQFFTHSELPKIPLLQQYDQYIRLATMSNELLEDILPRIRRQLSLKTSHARLREFAPTRGEIDWQRSLERSWSQSSGQPPLQFETRLRQRTLDTPENLLTVAILLCYRQEIEQVLKTGFSDEELGPQEQRLLIAADEQAERELAAPYARSLAVRAATVDLPELVERVSHLLPLGGSPYRDLIEWWQRFGHFRIGRAENEKSQTLASERNDGKTDPWLYELWLALEMIHLFQEREAIIQSGVSVATDQLQCRFQWNGQRYRFQYNRQLDTLNGLDGIWENAPATRPDYSIELDQEERNWRTRAVLLDAKYYLQGSDQTKTSGPIKKMLGDLFLLNAEQGFLFFPLIADPPEGESVTQSTRKNPQYLQLGQPNYQVHVCKLEPGMPLELVRERLGAILDLATAALVYHS